MKHINPARRKEDERLPGTTCRKRRSIYNLGRRPVMNEDEIAELVRHCVKFSPSAFNSQPCRVVVLFGADSAPFVGTHPCRTEKVTPPERFAATEAKIRSFDAGLGTILFFNDLETTANLQQKFPYTLTSFPLGRTSLRHPAISHMDLVCRTRPRRFAPTLQSVD
ncbi:MAG: nitroreductase family protein [Alphaproteobacteria bacterium]